MNSNTYTKFYVETFTDPFLRSTGGGGNITQTFRNGNIRSFRLT